MLNVFQISLRRPLWMYITHRRLLAAFVCYGCLLLLREGGLIFPFHVGFPVPFVGFQMLNGMDDHDSSLINETGTFAWLSPSLLA